MKTLLIETVTNGWIVRPFSFSEHWSTAATSTIAVYNNISELQKDLPKLLEYVSERSPQTVEGGDRRPETIGGSELTPSA